MKFSCAFSLLATALTAALSVAQDVQPPVVTDRNPLDGHYLGTGVNSFTFSATVTDDSPLDFVSVQFRRPDGSNTAAIDATFDSGAGIWLLNFNFDEDGIWRWRIIARDSPIGTRRGNTVRTDFFDVTVATTRTGVTLLARDEIEDLISLEETLGPKFVRMGFHDCVGGCDGCIDMQNGDNAGLDTPIAALEDIVTKYQNSALGISRADIWAIATLAGAEVALPGQPSGRFPLTHVGRTDCENGGECPVGSLCDSTNGPDRALPSPDLLTHEILTFFSDEFSFSTEETVALMGAHTLGSLTRVNSGFEGQWVNNNLRLTNAYYAALVGGTSPDDEESVLLDGPGWVQEPVNNDDLPTIPNRTQWIHTGGGGARTIMVNSDMALVRDLTAHLDQSTGESTCRFKCNGNNCNRPNLLPPCPAAQQTLTLMAVYKHNNTKFVDDFESVLGKMMVAGYDASTTCAEAVCQLGTRRMLRSRN